MNGIKTTTTEESYCRRCESAAWKGQRGNRCLRGYFVCSENLIVWFFYIIIDDTSSEFSNWVFSKIIFILCDV
jgi:hypothetical protein